MAMNPSTIKPGAGTRRKSKRVGRGNASQKGTTAARGTKGQRARSSGRRGTKLLGFRQSLLKIPKNRGFKSLSAKPQVVSLARLGAVVSNGEAVTPDFLLAKNFIRSTAAPIKLVGGGIDKKITVTGCVASKGALAAIEKVGGTVTF